MHLTTRIALAPLVLSRTTRDDGTLLSIAFDAGRLRGGPLPSRVELRLDASELGWGGTCSGRWRGYRRQRYALGP